MTLSALYTIDKLNAIISRIAILFFTIRPSLFLYSSHCLCLELNLHGEQLEWRISQPTLMHVRRERKISRAINHYLAGVILTAGTHLPSACFYTCENKIRACLYTMQWKIINSFALLWCTSATHSIIHCALHATDMRMKDRKCTHLLQANA